MRLGPSLNLPNGSLGSFGAVTPTETPYETRTQLFDVAAAGPVLGFGVALAMFGYGLAVRLVHSACSFRETQSEISWLFGQDTHITGLIVFCNRSRVRKITNNLHVTSTSVSSTGRGHQHLCVTPLAVERLVCKAGHQVTEGSLVIPRAFVTAERL